MFVRLALEQHLHHVLDDSLRGGLGHRRHEQHLPQAAGGEVPLRGNIGTQRFQVEQDGGVERLPSHCAAKRFNCPASTWTDRCASPSSCAMQVELPVDEIGITSPGAQSVARCPRE
ncbi:hypothetical protein [Burkholderia gladioli]|uniref:hypothetical protein n=1 Tax=Burkholderia gladioli TaxID=28095 RepID=UPI003D193C79